MSRVKTILYSKAFDAIVEDKHGAGLEQFCWNVFYAKFFLSLRLNSAIIMPMRLPHRDNAIINRKKLTRYLLSLAHEKGRSKAKFFRMIGFNEANIEEFEQALLKIGKSNKVVKIDKEKEEIVVKYVINGLIDAPNGKKYKIKTVWAVEVGSEIPHLATAHPRV